MSEATQVHFYALVKAFALAIGLEVISYCEVDGSAKKLEKFGLKAAHKYPISIRNDGLWGTVEFNYLIQ